MNRHQKFSFLLWLIAVIATLGSLFFSEVMEFPPCALCWYQRIAMYPLVILFFVGSSKDPRITFSFTAPFVAIGWLTALYHNLLHYEIVPEKASPCREGISCATVYIDWFGFITIPMLSFIAFTLMAIILFFLRKDYLNER
ncbi:MAG: disulfide oxidoreductase [Bacteriovoracaceae bacterium]